MTTDEANQDKVVTEQQKLSLTQHFALETMAFSYRWLTPTGWTLGH